MTEYNDEGQAVAPVVVRWVEALRSGRYTQTSKYLHAGDGFCCLGVLCDLDGDAGWDERGDTDETYGGIIYSTASGDTEMPGPEVLEWAGLSLSQSERLAEMNDRGASFEEIADEIERIYAAGENEYDAADLAAINSEP